MPDGAGYKITAAAAPPGPFTWADLDTWDEDDLPARPWITRGYLLRSAVTTIVGAGGVSKSSLVLAYAIALAIGARLHGFQPAEIFRSVVYNIEDDLTEQRRRLSAIGTSMGKMPADFASLIARTGPERIGMLFIRDPESREMEPTTALAELEALIVSHRADVLFVDPLAELHSEDENDNNAMRAVVAAFRQMAKRHNIAVVIIHHTRKGALVPGDAEASRGAGAIIGASRVMLTVVPMSPDEEKALGLRTDARRHFFRVDGAKANYSALTDCEWFERVPYTLTKSGEQVSVPVPWMPPVDVVTPEIHAKLIERIERGSVSGPWSPKIESRPRSVKQALTEVGIVTAKGQRAILERLLAEGFAPVKFRDGNRKWVLGIRAPSGKPDRTEWQDEEDEAL